MALTWPDKDPDDVLDFGMDFSPLVEDANDTITSTSAEVTSGTVTIAQHASVTGAQATVTWLRGGTVGETAEVRVRIVTTKGRQIDQSARVKIAQR